MSYRARNYVQPGNAMYRAASYDAEGRPVDATGPYATQGAASRSRSRISRRGVTVRVEVCRPTWEPVPGTEVEG